MNKITVKEQLMNKIEAPDLSIRHTYQHQNTEGKRNLKVKKKGKRKRKKDLRHAQYARIEIKTDFWVLNPKHLNSKQIPNMNNTYTYSLQIHTY